jgi:dynein intermediate chain
MMSDRKAELERKKEKLRLIREEKEKRKREREAADQQAGISKTESGEAGSEKAHHDINQQLKEMGINPVDDVLRGMPAAADKAVAAAAKAAAARSDDADNKLGETSLPLTPRQLRKKPVMNLGITTVHQTSIPPKMNDTYSKQTQTFESGNDSMPSRRGTGKDFYTTTFLDDDPDEFYEEDSLGLGSGSPSSGSPSNFHLTRLPPGVFPSGMPEVTDVKPAVTKEEEEKKKAEEEKRRKKDLSDEEKQKIMMSDDFHKFFDRSSRLVERALYEDINVFVDYTGVCEDNEGFEDKAGANVTFNRFFYDERWTKNRVITSMDWSTVFPELLVASYDKNPESAADPDGICLVWNTRFKKNTPENVFHCQSQVMSACFAKFHPNFILGGTYSGQIVLWDNRVAKRTPVQRSPLSAAAHTHPVYCMKVVGTQNAHNLISISTDGKMCSWSLDMLSQPQETLELQQKQSKAVAVTGLSFPAGDVNNFIVGSEEGAVYTACRHGSRAGVLDVFEGHQAPVTGLDTHPAAGTIDFGHLFLTCSMDWTIKLWSLKENRPLYSFDDSNDYVYDVAWSPQHPALFAAVDGTGNLDLWNLNSDTEVATASVSVPGTPALNRVSWTQSGLHVTAGDDHGKIWVYDVGEQLALPQPDEWNKFAYTLHDIKNNQTEEEFDTKMSSMGSSSGAASMMHPSLMGSMPPPGVGGGGSGPGSLSSLPSMGGSPLR